MSSGYPSGTRPTSDAYRNGGVFSDLAKYAGQLSTAALIVAGGAVLLGLVGVAGFVLSLTYTGTCDGESVCSRVRDLEDTTATIESGINGNPLTTLGEPFIVPNASNPTATYNLRSSSLEFNPIFSSIVVPTGNGYILQSRDTSGQTGDPGQLNGGGLGNKVFVGLRQACGVPLSSLDSISVSTYTRRGIVPQVSLNVLVDVEGDGVFDDLGDDCIAFVDATTDPRFDLPLSGAPVGIVLTPSSAVFRSVGAKCNLPGSVTQAPLSDILSIYANATIYCGEMGDSGYPVGTPMAGIQFIQGDSSLTTFKEVVLSDLAAVFTA